MAKLTTYTQNQKLEAVKLYLLSGNLSATAVALKIPYDTLKTWKYSDWWDSLSTEIKAEGRLEMSAKLKKIAEKALGETLDRLEHGDWRMSPTGQLVRVPVTAAVTAKIATDLIDKSEELDRQPTDQSLQNVTDRLKALQESFTKISSKIRKVEVFDAEFKDSDALPQREATPLLMVEGARLGEEVDQGVRLQTET